MTRGRAVRAALGLAVVLLLAAVGVLTVRVVDAHRTEDAAAAGAAAARTLTPVLLGYDWTTVDDDARRIAAATTGPFAAQNDAIVASLVVPAAVEGRVTSSAAVTDVAVITAGPDRVETLVLYTQTTTTRTGATAVRSQPRSARVVTAPGTDGRWLVAGFETL